EAFQQVIRLVPEDPLGYANLAVATLRQQKFDEAMGWIGRALARAPGDAELLAIRAEILQWSGKPDEALAVLREAAGRAPENVEIQYALYRQASIQPEGADGGAAQEALARLRELRPENLVVIMQVGQQAVKAGDRTAATGAFLRIRELIWQAPPAAGVLLEQILEALEENDLEAARLPALRLGNVLKITPMHREGLRELAPGIQGIPLARFREEPRGSALGRPVEVSFLGHRLSSTPAAGQALAVGDLDGDRRTDIAWVALEQPAVLEIRWSDRGKAPLRLPAAGVERLLVADLDNDGWLDLIGHGPEGLVVWRGAEGGRLQEATGRFGLQGVRAAAVAVIDFDIEGDLDLAVASGRRNQLTLYRNALSGPLQEVGRKSLPELVTGQVEDLLTSDLDRDGDLDLLIVHRAGLTWLDNLRQGQFIDRSQTGGLAAAEPARAALSVDLDNDGLPDLVTAGPGLRLYHNQGGRFVPWEIGDRLRTSALFTSVVALDADNDGRSDLAVAGPGGLVVLAQREGPSFEFLPLSGAPQTASALAAADLDADGDLDLVVAGPEGLHRLDNQGGNRNGWLSVRLRGLDKGNSKNNLFGLGATLEVRAATAYQFQEVTSDVTHFGLGSLPKADLLRVVWTNGVPQNRLDPKAQQWIVEEQVLKGSCPFLYAWDGQRVGFVTDLLWGAPAGLPLAPG
ncbi:MAG: FG-GAP-like repeat-containing protein, partial [Thermoanaerobaculia bacterium]